MKSCIHALSSLDVNMVPISPANEQPSEADTLMIGHSVHTQAACNVQLYKAFKLRLQVH